MTSEHFSRRTDIDGLRTLCAFLVVIFHIWLGGVSGGVDVFFVLAGYFLMSRSLRALKKASRFDAIEHYERFATRIAPETLVLLLVITPLCFLFVHPWFWAQYLNEISASAVFLENYYLIWKASDYLRRDEQISFLQHLWAVSIIGQVYILWPLLIAISERFAKLASASTDRSIRAVFLPLTAASFFWSLIYTSDQPAAAYFDFFTRFWQFGIGGLISHSRFSMPVSQTSVSNGLSWIGLGLIGSCGLIIGSQLPFPGYASLWPSAAAALLLIYGNPAERANAGYFLSVVSSSKFGIGSFGIYLWHWPLFWLAKHQGLMGTPIASILYGILIVMLSVFFSAASQLVVKQIRGQYSRTCSLPIKRARVLSIVFAATPLISVALMGLILNHSISSSIKSHIYQSSLLQPIWNPFSLKTDPFSRQWVWQDWQRCHQDVDDPELKTCVFGETSALKTTLVLVGSSHSGHWLPALREIAAKRSFKIITILKAGCRFGSPSDAGLSNNNSCKKWNVDALAKIKEIQPDFVFTLGTSGARSKKQREYVPIGFRSWFEELNRSGIKVIAVRDTPRMTRNVPDCIYQRPMLDPSRCGERRSDVLDDVVVAATAGNFTSNVTFVDPASVPSFQRHVRNPLT